MRRLMLLLGVCALPMSAVRAQGDDKAQVVAAVQKFFDGMRTRDTSLIRAVVDSSAVLMGPSAPRNGHVALRSTPIKNFMTAIANAKGDAWDERIYKPEVRVSDYLATVWADYDFYRGTQLSHCGVDAFQLAKVDGAWKIFQIADTHVEGAGCPKGK